jgi:6-pyruvoyltetrahydropterin/6-carboxytetrahydropterin synthase
MFAIEVQRTFCAAHALRLSGGGLEPLHGHNFHVTVKLTCAQLDALETVTDFHPVENALAGIIDAWNNGNLNDIEPFKTTVNPSAERIAEQIGHAMRRALGKIDADGIQNRQLRLAEVRLTEAPNCLALWISDE